MLGKYHGRKLKTLLTSDKVMIILDYFVYVHTAMHFIMHPLAYANSVWVWLHCCPAAPPLSLSLSIFSSFTLNFITVMVNGMAH